MFEISFNHHHFDFAMFSSNPAMTCDAILLVPPIPSAASDLASDFVSSSSPPRPVRLDPWSLATPGEAQQRAVVATTGDHDPWYPWGPVITPGRPTRERLPRLRWIGSCSRKKLG